MTIAEFQTYKHSIDLLVDKLRQSPAGGLAPINNSLCSDLLCLSGGLALLDLVKDVKVMSKSELLTMLTDLEAEERSATTRTGRDCAAYLFSVCEAEHKRRQETSTKPDDGSIVITTQAELEALPERFDKPTRIEIRGDETIHVRNHCAGSVVFAYSGSHVIACPGSAVFAYSGSHVIAYSGSTVDAWSGSKITANKGSIVHAFNGSIVHALNGSEVTANYGSEITAYKGSIIDARPGSEVTYI